MSGLKGIGHKALTFAEHMGLLVIALLTVVAMGNEVWLMFLKFKVNLPDLLLLFIYLEVLAMIGLYLKSGQLPVRMPLYIVIVALARYIILDMKNLDTMRLMGLAGAILVIALAVLIIRFGKAKYP